MCFQGGHSCDARFFCGGPGSTEGHKRPNRSQHNPGLRGLELQQLGLETSRCQHLKPRRTGSSRLSLGKCQSGVLRSHPRHLGTNSEVTPWPEVASGRREQLWSFRLRGLRRGLAIILAPLSFVRSRVADASAGACKAASSTRISEGSRRC